MDSSIFREYLLFQARGGSLLYDISINFVYYCVVVIQKGIIIRREVEGTVGFLTVGTLIKPLINIVEEYYKSWNILGKECIGKYSFSSNDLYDKKTIDIDWNKVLQCFNLAIDFNEEDESTYYYLALIHYGNLCQGDKDNYRNQDLNKILNYSRKSIGSTFGLCLHLSILYNWMHTNTSYATELNALFEKYDIIKKLKANSATSLDIFPFYADLCIHYNNGNSKITGKYWDIVEKWNIDFLT